MIIHCGIDSCSIVGGTEKEKSEEKIDCHHRDSNQGPSLEY